tara:strand:- start:1037 stop:1168 length:132 start_codon:yes stop_codon:yes gene_type:complete
MKKRNPIARNLRTKPEYKPKIIPNKKKIQDRKKVRVNGIQLDG